jgi:hypothetical protein
MGKEHCPVTEFQFLTPKGERRGAINPIFPHRLRFPGCSPYVPLDGVREFSQS